MWLKGVDLSTIACGFGRRKDGEKHARGGGDNGGNLYEPRLEGGFFLKAATVGVIKFVRSFGGEVRKAWSVPFLHLCDQMNIIQAHPVATVACTSNKCPPLGYVFRESADGTMRTSYVVNVNPGGW